MEYTIGEVSELLNLSRDMIRYYEKQGAIHSKRNEANNYRTYDDMEVFWLLEAVQHKSWGIPISEIANIRQNQFSASTEQFLEEEIARLNEAASYEMLLAERLQELKTYMQFGAVNIGNHWVTEMPATYRYFLVRGRGGDNYERIRLPKENSRFVFSEKMYPFFGSSLTAGEDYADWEITIDKKYVDAMGEPVLPESCVFVPASPALCTHVDIGDIGHFDPAVFHGIRDYAQEHGYTPLEGAPIRGLLLGRGYENGNFRRILRLYLPLQT